MKRNRSWVVCRGWWRGALACCLLVFVAGCGLPGLTLPPDTLEVTVTTSGAPGATGAPTQHFTAGDATKVRQLYDYIQGLKAIPRTVSVPCLPATRHYQLDFHHTGLSVFTATVGPCRNLMQTSGNIIHATDTTFWQLLDDAVGQPISQP